MSLGRKWRPLALSLVCLLADYCHGQTTDPTTAGGGTGTGGQRTAEVPLVSDVCIAAYDSMLRDSNFKALQLVVDARCWLLKQNALSTCCQDVDLIPQLPKAPAPTNAALGTEGGNGVIGTTPAPEERPTFPVSQKAVQQSEDNMWLLSRCASNCSVTCHNAQIATLCSDHLGTACVVRGSVFGVVTAEENLCVPRECMGAEDLPLLGSGLVTPGDVERASMGPVSGITRAGKVLCPSESAVPAIVTSMSVAGVVGIVTLLYLCSTPPGGTPFMGFRRR